MKFSRQGNLGQIKPMIHMEKWARYEQMLPAKIPVTVTVMR